MTDYDALRRKLLEGRKPAIVDGVFKGSLRQMIVCAAVSRVRNKTESVHQGEDAPGDAIVRWPGGSCALHEAARLSSEWVKTYARQMSDQIAADIARFEATPRFQDRKTAKEMHYVLMLCEKWALPIASEEEIDEELPRAKAACFRASGSLRDPRERLRMFRIGEAYISGFLSPWTIGNPGPAAAFARGETVTVDMEGAIIPWARLGHLGNYDMMRFNIELYDAVYRGVRAIDKARRWDSEEVCIDARIYETHAHLREKQKAEGESAGG